MKRRATHVDKSLASVTVTHGAVAFAADDVAKHCLSVAAPSAVDLGENALFVPDTALPACNAAIAELLEAGAHRSNRNQQQQQQQP
mmetsp:Transcript_7130/g.22326  ORF Transcript_7130/g.22326 Transcript_7130/m.22326 type:complete len:86 (+) Transcript_7130:35-292(+)